MRTLVTGSRSLMPDPDTAARDERILGAFRARERLRRWHELQRQKEEEESDDRQSEH